MMEQVMRSFEIESESILATAKVIDKEQLARAAEILAAAPRIAATGCGHSGIAARHFAHLLCCVERPARFLSPAEAVHGGVGFLQQGDVLVWASRGGKTDELTPILRIAKEKGATVIGVTEDLGSPLAKASDTHRDIGERGGHQYRFQDRAQERYRHRTEQKDNK